MNSRISKDLTASNIDWTKLKKSKLIIISNKLFETVKANVSDNSEIVSNFNIDYKDSSVSYNNEEFLKYFSDNIEYKRLMLYSSKSFIGLSIHFFYKYSDIPGLVIESNSHTTAQLEDIYEELASYIYDILSINNVNQLLQNTNSINISNIINSNNIIDSNNTIDSNNVINSYNSKDNMGNNTKVPFYKNGVFWTAFGAIIALAALIWAIMPHK